MDYLSTFLALLIICVGVQWYVRAGPEKVASIDDAAFSSFRINWLLVYLLVMAADWLQGPYVYQLYLSYGYDKAAIGQFFIAGFLSSAVFGTFVGAIADKYGRRRLSQAFCVIYGISCLTKLVNHYWVLMFGRLCAGIATSLLFSVFEAWMIFEHTKRGFSMDWISNTFAAATLGNGIVAVGSGLVADFVARMQGFVAPFMVALVLLMVTLGFISGTWDENYGDSHVSLQDTFINPLNVLLNNKKIALLGLVQSLFEASMYTFVFMWTPAILAGSPANTQLPFGIIFASFMVCVMIGSALFSLLIQRTTADIICRGVLIMSAVSMVVPVLVSSPAVVLISFFVFEIACGMWWPTIGTLRGQYVPESTRAALMNFFRVPLNLLVAILMLQVGYLRTETVFLVATIWLVFAAMLQFLFTQLPNPTMPAVTSTAAGGAPASH